LDASISLEQVNAIPFDYCGEVRGSVGSSSGESFQDQFRRGALHRLEKAKAEIEFDGPEVCFHGSNSLAAIFRSTHRCS
jgi:hypothetical protein